MAVDEHGRSEERRETEEAGDGEAAPFALRNEIKPHGGESQGNEGDRQPVQPARAQDRTAGRGRRHGAAGAIRR